MPFGSSLPLLILMEFHYDVRFGSVVDAFDSIPIKMLRHTRHFGNVMINHLSPVHYRMYVGICLQVLTESAAKHMFSCVQHTIN